MRAPGLVLLLLAAAAAALTTTTTTTTTAAAASASAPDADECAPPNRFEVAVVGGGPAGLQATLTLARSNLRVVNLDADEPRNGAEATFHNFLGGDGKDPREFKREARERLERAYGVRFVRGLVASVRGTKGNFVLETAAKEKFQAERIILATGVTDEKLDAASGLEGTGNVFQCPFCHGWEHRAPQHKWCVVVPSYPMPPMSLMMASWDPHATLLLNGSTTALDANLQALIKAKTKMTVVAEPIESIERDAASRKITGVRVRGGATVACSVLMQKLHQNMPPIVSALGLKVAPAGHVAVGAPAPETSIPGILAAGDVAQPFHSWAAAVQSGAFAAAFTVMDLAMGKVVPPAPKA